MSAALEPSPTRGLILALSLALAVPIPAAEHAVVRSQRGAVVEIRTAALLMSGQQGGALPIALGALPSAADTVTLMVEIDGAALLGARPESGPLVIEVFAYALAGDLEVLDQRSFTVEVDLGVHGEILAGTGLKAFVPLGVPPAGPRFRVLARVGATFGLRSLELPAVADGERADRILPPVFHQLDESWLLSAPGDVEIDLPSPFALAAGSPVPTTQPVLVPGQSISGQVFIGGAVPEAALVARVRAPDGEITEAPLAVIGHPAAAASGLRAISISFSAPDLATGRYELAVTVKPAADDAPAAAAPVSGFVPIFITAASLPVDGTLAANPLAPLSRAPSRGQKDLVRSIAAGYREALGQLAGGERRAALATLAAIETGAVDQLDAEAVTLLARGETRLLASLDDGQWHCVLPVILLHLDLSRQYRQSGRFIVAHHATQMVVTLAEAYAQKLGTPEAELEAAQSISSLAGYLQLRGARSQSKSLYTEALALAGREQAALLGLGTLLEKIGRFEEAARRLTEFVAARPGDREGRLRLALNLYRIGDAETARLGLEELVAEGGAEWVAVVAHQELARIEMDELRSAEAAGILRRGLERWPAHPTLLIQLAYVLGAQGEARESRQILERLELNEGREASERSRYNRWPEWLLSEVRQTLADSARERLSDLDRWLAGQPRVAGG